jgi:hypothetical protein
MGGQACVFYGAAQVSKDVDFVILADQANLASLRQALFEEMADEQERDRVYWEPLKKELEGWRKREAGA